MTLYCTNCGHIWRSRLDDSSRPGDYHVWVWSPVTGDRPAKCPKCHCAFVERHEEEDKPYRKTVRMEATP